MNDEPTLHFLTEPEVLPPPIPAQRSNNFAYTLRWIFLGPKGIRAGWSILIFFGMMIASVIPIGLILQVSSDVMTPTTAILGELLSAIFVLVPTFGMSLIERKPFLSYGFRDRRALPRLASGFVIGFLAITALMALLLVFGLIKFDKVALSGFSMISYGLQWTFAFFLLAIFEESMFRGYLQYTLARGLNFWWAGIILSTLFGCVHIGNTGENWIGVLQVIAAGLLFVLSLRLTGSLAWAIGLHAGWDWAPSYFYGVADSGMVVQGHLLSMHPIGNKVWSGGAVGPEGSPLSILVEIAIAIGIWSYWRRPRDEEQNLESSFV